MKKFVISISAIVLLSFLIYGAARISTPQTLMNTDYVNGNTAGNLYNGGLFCEHNGTIYFSNPSDGGRLYSMDSNGQNLKKLSNDIATYINADDNYVYYIRNNAGESISYHFFSMHRNALVRIDHDGKNIVILDTQPSLYASLLGNYIFYIHYDEENASTLYKVRIDGEEQKQVFSKPVYTCNASGQYFYYNGMDTDGSIHRFDTKNDTTTTIYEGNCFQPIVNDGNDMYYIDGSSDYAIVHTNITFNNPTYLTKDSVDAYNVYGSYIYYQRFDKEGSALCMIKKDGSEFRIIKEGDFCDIHVTSYYVFFRDYHSDKMYYFPRTNPEDIRLFHPGMIEK